MKLNAGCGDNFWGDIRVDIDSKAKAATHIQDLVELDWPDCHFEETRCISVLEHIPDWKKAVAQICRVTNKRLIIEVPVNSDLRKTDVFRLLFPTPKNLKLFFNLKARASKTFWQFNPETLAKTVALHGFIASWELVFRWYAGMPSRCWRITGLRNCNNKF